MTDLRFGVNYGYWTNMKAPHWPDWESLIEMNLDLLPVDIKHRHWYDPSYHPSMVSVARHTFNGIDKIKGSYSQSMQDIFVLTLLDGKKNGTYLELGSFEPIKYNNTFLLTHFDWTGISIDIDKKLNDLWKQQRPGNKFLAINAMTLDYASLLTENDFPEIIDYLQIDIDQGQGDVDVLSNLLATKKRFAVITFEHEQIFQKQSSDLLSAHGYELLAENIVCKDFLNDTWHIFEDWWIDSNVVNKKIIDKFKNIAVSMTYPFELFCIPGTVDHLLKSIMLQKDIWKQGAVESQNISKFDKE